MRMRHIRLLAAAGTAVTALALSACGAGGTGTKDEGASRSVSPTAATATAADKAPGKTSAGTPATRAHTPPGKAGGTRTGGSGTTSGTASGTSGTSGSSPVLCNGANTRVTARPMSRPLNHMLLTVTNTGRRTCELTYYPIVRFDEMQWAPQADKDTQPQAVTTLKPGESGYASMRLSAADGSGEGGTTARKLTLMFQGMTPNSDGGATATPTLPAKGVYYDSSLTVTYWQQSLDDIAAW
ncbi:DUF4232 domain-containing protein [Streptomyces sp. NPDC004232]|uniref:DUF4232 domain-containing protein n=1 Tax=Streptomyces sp. NPDC004232 TaxID=3154454 RepID=UPI001D335DB9|nr:DUF4232 domain-containing protein [Streptomyces sp. tea 10]